MRVDKEEDVGEEEKQVSQCCCAAGGVMLVWAGFTGRLSWRKSDELEES